MTKITAPLARLAAKGATALRADAATITAKLATLRQVQSTVKVTLDGGRVIQAQAIALAPGCYGRPLREVVSGPHTGTGKTDRAAYLDLVAKLEAAAAYLETIRPNV